MKVAIEGAPAFCYLSVVLNQGDKILSRGGTMASMDGQIQHSVRLRKGLLSGILGARLAGETVFLNHFQNTTSTPQHLTLAPPVPGHIEKVTVDKRALYLQGRSFLACTPGIELSLSWAGFRSWFAGEGLFHLRARGRSRGVVWFSCYGAARHHELAEKETLLVDTTHLVAYQQGISWRIALGGASVFRAFASGEGFITRLRGPGQVTLQSRSLKNLAHWSNPHLS